jgi:transcriptional regulator with GAF, ATPase, and Fis domain
MSLSSIGRDGANDAVRRAILSALHQTGSVRGAARALGTDRANLKRAMRRLGITDAMMIADTEGGLKGD